MAETTLTVGELLKILDAKGVRLSADLVVDAPPEALTPELRDALTVHKALLLNHVVRGLVLKQA
jgi:hypothetical protein